MSSVFQPFTEGVDALRARFRELSLVENDVKRDLAWAQQNLEGIRQLKRELQQQIFHAAADRGSRTSLNEVTTAYNGQTSTDLPRS